MAPTTQVSSRKPLGEMTAEELVAMLPLCELCGQHAVCEAVTVRAATIRVCGECREYGAPARIEDVPQDQVRRCRCCRRSFVVEGSRFWCVDCRDHAAGECAPEPDAIAPMAAQ